MQISILLMQEIVKLFVIMFMGYAVVKAGLMKASESKSVSVILVYLVNPCVIVNAFQVEYTPEVQKGLILAVMAAVVIHLLYLLLTAILKHPLHLNVIERATAIYSNAGILVIPLVQVLLGQEYVIYSSAFITVQLVLLWTHCKSMLCEESKLEWKKVILFVSRISLPSGVQSVLGMMNNLMGPLGMLLAGMVIADVSMKNVFLRKRNYLPAALRLLIYPVLALVVMKIISLFAPVSDFKQILLTVYLASVTPACTTVTSMAQLYDKDAGYASSLYVLTTLLSIVTMPVMVYLYEMMM